MGLKQSTQVQQLLNEQGMKGIVRQDELADKGRVRGVDYLFVGKVTNFRVKEVEATTGAGLARLGGIIGGVDVEKSQKHIQVDCGVDLRLVDPEDGSLLSASFGEYKRTDSVSALGVEILGTGVRSEGDLRLDKSNRGKILRLALDEALRRMLPDIDSRLHSASKDPAPASAKQPQDTGYCPQCGGQVASEAKFCRECGAGLQ